MTLLFIIFIIVLLLSVLLFTVKSKVSLFFDSTNSDMHLTLFWLYPLLRSVMTKGENGLVLTIYLLNKRILTKQIKQKQNVYGNRNILGNLNPTDIHVNTQYGFRDPFVTGLACSTVTMVSEFFNVESLRQKPDFLAINDYINLNATAKLNLGRSLLKLI
ncbi:MAG: hypothetical protein APF77_19020 [Clostridia bacterium BRH_c25]|nr:MAG: hypothetical protein APF77_19020 [Clostridia bacterium BRH_c25]